MPFRFTSRSRKALREEPASRSVGTAGASAAWCSRPAICRYGPGWTWWDLGRHLSLPELVAIADVIVKRDPTTRLVVPRGVRGAANLRAAGSLADPGSRSPQESILRVHLHLARLPAPKVNFDVVHRGEWIGCGDLVWSDFTLYVEYEGPHHDNPRQRHQDARRPAIGSCNSGGPCVW